MRRNYNNAKTLQSQSPSTTFRDYGAKNFAIDLEQDEWRMSFQQQFDSSNPKGTTETQCSNESLGSSESEPRKGMTRSRNASNLERHNISPRVGPAQTQTNPEASEHKRQSIELHVAIKKGYLRGLRLSFREAPLSTCSSSCQTTQKRCPRSGEL